MSNRQLKLSGLRATVVQGWLIVVASFAVLSENLTVRSPDQSHVAIIDGQGEVKYRRTFDNGCEATFFVCHGHALAFSDDGELLAAAGGLNGTGSKLKVWRLSDRRQLCEIVISSGPVVGLAVSRDGDLIAAATADRRVELWRISTGERHWLRMTPEAVQSLRFSSDSKSVVVRHVDGTEIRVDATTGRLLKKRNREIGPDPQLS